MISRIKRFTAILLALAVMLTSCAPQSSASAGQDTAGLVEAADGGMPQDSDISVSGDMEDAAFSTGAPEEEFPAAEQSYNEQEYMAADGSYAAGEDSAVESQAAAGMSDSPGMEQGTGIQADRDTVDVSDPDTDVLTDKGKAAEQEPGTADAADNAAGDAADLFVPDAADMVTSEYFPDFYDLDESGLLQYIQDSAYASLEYGLDSDDYIIEDISAVYISREYLEELEYNSQENIFFGYSLTELEGQFDGDKFIFTLDDNGRTVVKKLEAVEDTTFRDVMADVAIGSGVILVCATVSVLTAGTGLPPAVSLIFAASAKTGAVMALNAGAFGAVSAGVVTGITTGDMDEALQAAALAGGEAFKWGAITGVITGGAGKALELRKAARAIPTPQESEARIIEAYNADAQKSYINGKEVPWGTNGSTRPDCVRMVDGHLEAIEVKNYDLANPNNRSSLLSVLKNQVQDRVMNLPEGSTQRVVLDVRNRNYSSEMVDSIVSTLTSELRTIDPSIIVEAFV